VIKRAFLLLPLVSTLLLATACTVLTPSPTAPAGIDFPTAGN